MQLVVGSNLEPRIPGKALSASSFVLLLAVLFCALIWWIAGAVIGVPILIGLAAAFARFRSTRGVALSLSAGKDAAADPA
ncbi:MAG: hypothetical protein SNJ73_05715 [Acetobacteraceae bacterium]